MTLQQRNRGFALILFVSVSLATGIFVSYQISTNAQNGQKNLQPQDKLQGAMNGRKIIELDDPEWRQNVPLQALASESTVIAVGKPLRNACHPSQNGQQVTTDYEVRLEEVIKGNLQPNSLISVSMPGGMVRESNGDLLEVRARHVRKMRNGRTYVLFLKKAIGKEGILTTMRGSQGIYEIPANGQRVVHLGRSFELPPADDGQEVSAFLQAVRAMSSNQ
ncbi:MAG: hypothetical protein LC768_15020 [Acidobacteria bacterium]|nr:hypothetical protein [Acidobacteriota bacterium]MCA1639619.1 hypothetical protein [Acidobacteriota bacterium]